MNDQSWIGAQANRAFPAPGEKLWNVTKEFVPYVRYIDPNERDRFLKLSQQQQTRELLLQDLEAVLELGGMKVVGSAAKKIVSPMFKKMFPKTAKNVSTAAKEIQIGKKYAGSVNTERQAISSQAKMVEHELYDAHGIKTSVSHDEMIERANKLVADYKENPQLYAQRVEAIKGGATPTIEEELAHRVMNATKMDEFVDVSQKVAAGDLPKQALDSLQEELTDQFINVANPLASQAGRRLNMYNVMVGRNRAFKAVGQLGKKLNKRQVKELAEVDWEDASSVNRFIKRLPDPKLQDYVYEYWYNSILSGIPTHVVNVASNTLWRMFQIPHRALSGAVDAVITPGLKTFNPGRQRTRYVNEIIPMMAGYLPKRKKAARAAWQVVRHNKVSDFETKWALEMAQAEGAFERSPYAALRAVGKVITPPTKALRAMDVYANSIAYDSQMGAIAKRLWNKGARAISGEGKFSKFKDFHKKFAGDPPEWAHKEAMEFAKYTTFMDDPGKIAEGIMKIRGAVPGGRFVVPFVNTIGNLMKRGLEMTPGVGIPMGVGKNASDVIAKQLEGALVAYLVLDKFKKGEITGGAPESAAEREAFYRQGKKAWSIKMGDKWIQYRRIEPFNTVIAAAANAYDQIQNAQDEETATEIFQNTAVEFKNNLIDSSYFQGLTQVLDRHSMMRGAEKRLVSSFVPYSSFFRSINRSYEVATQGSAKLRDTDTWLGAFSQVIPGLSDATPSKLNVWGEEIELEGGVLRQWLPYKWSTQTPDKTEKFLQELGVYPGHTGQRFTYEGETYKFDDDIYRDLEIMYGHKLKRFLDKRVESSAWQRAIKNPEKHELLIKEINSEMSSLKHYLRGKAIKLQKQKGL